MTAQVLPSGRSDPIEIAGGKQGEAPLVLVAIDQRQAGILGKGFAAIDPWARYPYPASALTKYFAEQEAGAPRYAVLADGELAGALGLRLNWLRGPYIQFLGLLSSHQGAGAGVRLLTWTKQQAIVAGARNLWVAASDFNGDAIRFYERFGFARVAELEGLVRDERNEILFRKRL